MSPPIETYVALYNGSYSARLVDGRLEELVVASADEVPVQDARLVELLNHALQRHDDEVLARHAPDPGPAEQAIAEHLERALQEADRLVEQSPSLQRELQERPDGAAHTVGRSRSGDVRITVAGGRVVELEIGASLRAQRQRVITAEIDEALADAWGGDDSAGQQQMLEYATRLTPDAVAADAEALAERIRKGRSS